MLRNVLVIMLGDMIGKMKSRVLLVIQLLAFSMFYISFSSLVPERMLFDGSDEFLPVSALVVDYERLSERYSYDYNNTYQYEVNGQKYEITLRESSRNNWKFLYYNPDNPQQCSVYRSYAEAKRKFSVYTNMGLILQGIVLVFVLIALWKAKKELAIRQSCGVVLNDDFDVCMKSGDRESDEIPKKSDEISMSPNNVTEGQTYALYTEEEYMGVEK